MKKLRLLMVATVGCLALYSCNDDDDNNSGGNVDLESDLTGTYELSKAIVPTAEDFDNDGDTNTNLVLEGTCYNSSWISFHADGTYEQHYSWSTMAEGGATLECDMAVATGTYTQSGSSVTTTQLTGDVDLSATYQFDAEAHTLSTTTSDATYYGWNTATSLFAELTGNLQIEFTKYTENEDDNGNTQNDETNISASGLAEVVGSFDLSSYLVTQAQDLNQDGETSANLALESDCYSESSIVFNADGTYEETTTYNVLAALGTALTCETQTEVGFWTRRGDTVYMHQVSAGTVLSTALALDTAANTISETNEDGEYVSFNSVTSLFAMLTGTVDLVYTQSQN